MIDFQERLANKTISHFASDRGEFLDLATGAQQFVPEIQMVIEDYQFLISNPITLDPALQAIDELLQARVMDVDVTDDHFKVATDKGWFSIDLRPESWVAPEAMVIYGPDNLIIVWN